jgi:hypothetical protein
MLMGKSAFLIVFTLMGTFAAVAQCPPPGSDPEECYLLQFQNLRPRTLPIRAPDINSTEKWLNHVVKIKLLPGEKELRIGQADAKFCHVETALSARGGPPPTQGWIDSAFIGRRARTCSREVH